MTREFKGWHMAAIMVAFFGVVIAVNLVMARSAIRTFGGAVVENSYVASQRYNGWLAEGRAQARLGWRAQVRGEPGGLLAVRLAAPDGPVTGAEVSVEVEHPLGRLPGRSFTLTSKGDGRYVAPHALTPGRWRVRVAAHGRGHDARFIEDIRL